MTFARTLYSCYPVCGSTARNGSSLFISLVSSNWLSSYVSLQSVDNSQKKKTPPREISVSWFECLIILPEPEWEPIPLSNDRNADNLVLHVLALMLRKRVLVLQPEKKWLNWIMNLLSVLSVSPVGQSCRSRWQGRPLCARLPFPMRGQ